MGRATQYALLWRLERGDRIGTLDILAGSTSLANTVASQLALRTDTPFGLAIAVVWLLSPVGGKASFRVLGIETSARSEITTYKYYAPCVGNGWAIDFSAREVQSSAMNALFDAGLVAPLTSRSSPRDLWENVKLPRIELFENLETSRSDPRVWHDINDGKGHGSGIFASRAGGPILMDAATPGYVHDLSRVENKLMLHASYCSLDCFQHQNLEVFQDTDGIARALDSDCANIVWTEMYGKPNLPFDTTMTFAQYRDRTARHNMSARPLQFAEKPTGLQIASRETLPWCNLRNTYVEALVSCTEQTSA